MRSYRALELTVRQAVVQALTNAGFGDDQPRRTIMMNAVREQLKIEIDVPNNAPGKVELILLVERCAKEDSGMATLLLAAEYAGCPPHHHESLRQLIEGKNLLPHTSEESAATLHDSLAGLAPPELFTLACRAAGLGSALVRPRPDAWETFLELRDINTSPGKLAPSMAFLEYLAALVNGKLGATLTAWNNQQAQESGETEQLWQCRAEAAGPIDYETPLRLLIAIEHDAIDADHYVVSHWRQDDPLGWPPKHTESTVVAFDDLERQVDVLLRAVEIEWAETLYPVSLEFILPRQLLATLPVHQWRKENDSPNPVLLCVHYPIVVRSLERMTARHWRREWLRRWHRMVADPSPSRVYFPTPDDVADPGRLDVVLSDQRWAVMVLSAPPEPIAQPGGDELTAALQWGLPALVWSASENPAHAVRDIVAELVSDNNVSTLPADIHRMRRDSIMSRAQTKTEVERDLVILWDDPYRVVAVDRPVD